MKKTCSARRLLGAAVALCLAVMAAGCSVGENTSDANDNEANEANEDGPVVTGNRTELVKALLTLEDVPEGLRRNTPGPNDPAYQPDFYSCAQITRNLIRHVYVSFGPRRISRILGHYVLQYRDTAAAQSAFANIQPEAFQCSGLSEPSELRGFPDFGEESIAIQFRNREVNSLTRHVYIRRANLITLVFYREEDVLEELAAIADERLAELVDTAQ
ncbi:MAG: hypothetical protein WEB00_09330 [Dehalococcoidia bacterium]